MDPYYYNAGYKYKTEVSWILHDRRLPVYLFYVEKF